MGLVSSELPGSCGVGLTFATLLSFLAFLSALHSYGDALKFEDILLLKYCSFFGIFSYLNIAVSCLPGLSV